VQENWDDNFISSIKLVIDSDDVYINGKLTRFETRDLNPVVYDGHAFLPIGLIAELIKATIVYDGDRNAVIETEGTRVGIFVGQNTITVNSENKVLEAASFILRDWIMVPLNVMEFLGFDKPIWNLGSEEIMLMRAYQTHRLIVVTNGSELVETYGALQVIEGPNDLYILQYDSEQAAREAMLRFNNDPSILFSQPDEVLHSQASDSLSWGVGRVGADFFIEQLQNRLKKNEVIVAVIDSGID
jgi:hypothetical protein